jgi:outer membrane protein
MNKNVFTCKKFRHFRRKKFAKYAFVILFAQVGHAYTINECLEMTRLNSYQLESVRYDIDQAQAAQNEALSYLLPHIQIEGRYELKNNQRDYSVFTDFGSAFSSKTIGVTADWLVFDFFSSWNFYKAGRHGTQAARHHLDKTRLAIDEEMKSCYFRYLETDHAIHVIEESIHTLEQQRQTSSDYFQQGITSKADLLTVEVLLAEKKKALLHAHHEHIEAQMAMNRCLGHELFAPLVLDDVPSANYCLQPVGLLQKLALLRRSDRLAFVSQVEALEARYKASQAMHAPKFFLYGGYNFLKSAPPQSPQADPQRQNWVTGGLGMQFPLFEGGKTNAQAQKALAQLMQARIQLEEFDILLTMEVEKACRNLEEQLAHISIEKAAIDLAEENLRSTQDRYSQGLVSINDCLQASEQLAQSRMGEIQAVYRAHSAYAHLLTVIGGELP